MTELFIQLDKIRTRTTERHMDVLEVYILEVYGFLATTLATTRYDSFNEPKNNNLHSLSHSYSGWDQLVEANSAIDHLAMWLVPGKSRMSRRCFLSEFVTR